MGLVEEEDEGGLVRIADLGQILEEVREQPHEERREERGGLAELLQLEHGDDARAVLVDAEQVGGVELGFAEEDVAALRGEFGDLAEDDADGRLRCPADALELRLALVRGEVGEHRPEVGEVEERETGLVRVVEDEGEDRFLGVVEFEDLREQDGPERGHGRPDRSPESGVAEGVELRRVRLRVPLLTGGLEALGELVRGHPGRPDAREVALDVGGEDGNARAGELLGEDLEGDGLAGAGGPGDESVSVEHREWNRDGYVRCRGLPVERHPQVEGGAVEGVSGLERVDRLSRHGPIFARTPRGVSCPDPTPDGSSHPRHLPA
ncbi:Uncharacterised protein [Mycobacteroides abscessus subsp. abscessus]|nr:Uncharacterised protein [Mycobacteroides abscessus subsp. abscessus]